METVQNELLNLVAVRAAMETGKVSQVSGPKHGESGDEFRKLMEESRRSEQPRKEEPQPAGKQETSQKPESPKTDEGPILEQQMSLAAMAILYPALQPRTAVAEQPQAQAAAAVEPQMELQPQTELLQPQTQAQAQLTGTRPRAEAAMQAGDASAEELPAAAPVRKEQNVEMGKVPAEKESPDAAPSGKQQLIDKPRTDLTQKPQAPVRSEESSAPETKVLNAEQAPEQPLFREVETVPVKVGEVENAEKKPQPVSHQLEHQISQAIQNGESRAELELEPSSLGKVRIELTLQQDGSLHVLLRAEKPSTQVLLDRGAGELQGLLGRETRQEVLVETSRYQEEQPQLFDRDPQQGQEQQGRQDSGDREQDQRQNRDQNESFFQQLRLGLTSTDVL